MSTDKGHQFFNSGESDRHMNGVSFLVCKDSKNTVLGCQPISGRLIIICLGATPFNITVIQAYAPISYYSEEDTEEFCNRVKNTIDKAPKKDIIIIQGD